MDFAEVVNNVIFFSVEKKDQWKTQLNNVKKKYWKNFELTMK